MEAILKQILEGQNQLFKEVAGINGEIAGIKEEFVGIKKEVSGIKEEVSGIKGEFVGIKEEVSGIKEEIAGIKGEVVGIKGEFAGVKEEVSDIKSYMSTKTDIVEVKQSIAIMDNKIDVLAAHQEENVMGLLKLVDIKINKTSARIDDVGVDISTLGQKTFKHDAEIIEIRRAR